MSQSFADDDHVEAYELLRAGEILSLEKILVIARKEVQGHILEVELEREKEQIIYELKVLDLKGVVWEIKVNASSGVVIEVEQD